MSYTKIQILYDKIPKTVCKDGCAKCCYDMIQVSPSENEHMGGYEWNGKCVFLVDNHCSIYEKRAFICRLFGASETMKCEGCVAERFLSEGETRELVSEYVRIKRMEGGG